MNAVIIICKNLMFLKTMRSHYSPHPSNIKKILKSVTVLTNYYEQNMNYHKSSDKSYIATYYGHVKFC